MLMIINTTPNFCIKVILSFKINQARNIVITGNVDAVTIKIASLTPPEVPKIINKRPAESRKPWIRNINHHFIVEIILLNNRSNISNWNHFGGNKTKKEV